MSDNHLGGTTMGIDVRGEPADLDAPWMTDVLTAVGVADGAKVVDLQFESFIGTGQTAATPATR